MLAQHFNLWVQLFEYCTQTVDGNSFKTQVEKCKEFFYEIPQSHLIKNIYVKIPSYICTNQTQIGVYF